MRNLKRAISVLLLLAVCICAFSACQSKKTITIYSSSEDYRNEAARKMLNEKFPEYNINLVDSDTGTIAAKVKAEGANSDADIILELEAGYMNQLSDSFAELKNVDFDAYVDDLVPANHKYVPMIKVSGCIAVNKTVLEEKGLAVPATMDDLLKPEYKGLISMPSPKSSGTGYIFLLNMINERGEEAAFEYFDKLAENLSGQGFTTSGSGPVNAIVMGEAAIGLSLTNIAVEAKNNGTDIEVVFPETGAPYTLYSSGVIAGKDTDADVMKVFDYIVSDVIPNDKALYGPEQIYKDQNTTLPNYPETIPYGDMTNIDDPSVKDGLLEKWKY